MTDTLISWLCAGSTNIEVKNEESKMRSGYPFLESGDYNISGGEDRSFIKLGTVVKRSCVKMVMMENN